MDVPSELGMVGTTFRRAGQAGLAALTLGPSEAELMAQHQALHVACNLAESVYLATCNRVEVIFATQPGGSVARARKDIAAYFAARSAHGAHPQTLPCARDLHAFAGEGAIERLFVVASALDSMVPGEAQILGQVKAAYTRALADKLAGQCLRPMFEAAFAAAKRVRQHTALGQGRTSMLSLTLHLIDDRLAGRPQGAGRVVVVGAGDMAEQCGRALGPRRVPLVFVNRTEPRARALAARYGGEAMGLAEYLRAPAATDVLVTATAAQEPLFTDLFFRTLAEVHAPQAKPLPLVIDLAVPPDVAVGERVRERLTLVDVDRMQAMAEVHAQGRREAVAAARTLLDEALDTYRLKEAERAMGRAIAQVRAHDRTALETQLDALKAQLPEHVLQHAWPEIERFARQTFGRLAHTSTRGLKALAHDHGPQALHAYLRGAGLEAESPHHPVTEPP